VAVGDAAAQPGDTVVDAKGALVAPGLVDLGVFAIDKPAFHFGGITRAALMPDQSPPLDRPRTSATPRRAASPTSGSTPCRRHARAGRARAGRGRHDARCGGQGRRHGPRMDRRA
jgi:dihydroorotase-like cyclic amidohydrolase